MRSVICKSSAEGEGSEIGRRFLKVVFIVDKQNYKSSNETK